MSTSGREPQTWFIDIGKEEFFPSMTRAVLCDRCGQLVPGFTQIDARTLHRDWHAELDRRLAELERRRP